MRIACNRPYNVRTSFDIDEEVWHLIDIDRPYCSYTSKPSPTVLHQQTPCSHPTRRAFTLRCVMPWGAIVSPKLRRVRGVAVIFRLYFNGSFVIFLALTSKGLVGIICLRGLLFWQVKSCLLICCLFNSWPISLSYYILLLEVSYLLAHHGHHQTY